MMEYDLSGFAHALMFIIAGWIHIQTGYMGIYGIFLFAVFLSGGISISFGKSEDEKGVMDDENRRDLKKD